MRGGWQSSSHTPPMIYPVYYKSKRNMYIWYEYANLSCPHIEIYIYIHATPSPLKPMFDILCHDQQCRNESLRIVLHTRPVWNCCCICWGSLLKVMVHCLKALKDTALVQELSLNRTRWSACNTAYYAISKEYCIESIYTIVVLRSFRGMRHYVSILFQGILHLWKAFSKYYCI